MKDKTSPQKSHISSTKWASLKESINGLLASRSPSPSLRPLWRECSGPEKLYLWLACAGKSKMVDDVLLCVSHFGGEFRGCGVRCMLVIRSRLRNIFLTASWGAGGTQRLTFLATNTETAYLTSSREVQVLPLSEATRTKRNASHQHLPDQQGNKSHLFSVC